MAASKVFIDMSGSTNAQVAYWGTVAAIVEKTGASAQYFLFNVEAHPVALDQVRAIAAARAGQDGTLTSSIAKHCRPDDAIWIITDGEVAPDEVAKCDALLDGMAFTRVIVTFVQTAGTMNLSVSAPFTRNTPSCEIFVNGELLHRGRTDQTIDLAAYAAMTPDAFLAAAEALRQQVLLQNMGRTNLTLRNTLLDLQEKLLATLAREASRGTEDAFVALRAVLPRSFDEGLAGMRAIIARAADGGIGARIGAVFQELLRACDTKDFSFAALAPSRLTRAAVVHAPAAEELPLPEESFGGAFDCPVTLDAAIPVCLVAAGAPVLEGVDKKLVESLMNNPLLLLHYPLLVAHVRKRIDHLLGLDTIKALHARAAAAGDRVLSPLTRAPVAALLTFGREREHIKTTNHALASLFFGQKLVGLPELWLAVVYFIVQDYVPYLAEQPAFMAAFKDHLVHRMRTRHTNLTLSGQPIEPLIKAPIDVAVWYCAVSPYLWETLAERDKDCNRLRAFGPAAPHLLRLVEEVLGYAYNKEATLHWCALYRAFAWMMNAAKDPATAKTWHTLIRAQVQNSVRWPNGPLILLDGPATHDTRPALPQWGITLEEVFTLAADHVDAGKTVNAVFIPRALPVRALPPVAYNYAYPRGDLDAQSARGVPELSPLTFRPVVVDRQKRKHWLACVQEALKITDMHQQLSMYNYFIQCVQDLGHYPTRPEYMLYVAQKQAAREDGGAKDTLPEHMVAYTDALFANYETILGAGFASVAAADFMITTTVSMPRDVRSSMDGSDKLQ